MLIFAAHLSSLIRGAPYSLSNIKKPQLGKAQRISRVLHPKWSTFSPAKTHCGKRDGKLLETQTVGTIRKQFSMCNSEGSCTYDLTVVVSCASSSQIKLTHGGRM